MSVVFTLQSIETSWCETTFCNNVAELIENHKLKLELEGIDERVDDGFESEVLCVVESDDNNVAENDDHLDEDQDGSGVADLLVE